MAKQIIEMVRDKIAAMKPTGDDDPQRQEKFDAAEGLSKLAVAAISDGVKSRAWEKFMSEFVEKGGDGNPLDPDQLSRLLAEDGSADNPDLSRNRAYLVGNAVCGTGSPFTGGLDRRVESIDDGVGAVACVPEWEAQPMNG